MTDDSLVVRARRDREAFAVLYNRYYPRVFRYCLRRLFIRDVAEDATSEIFLQVAAHLPSFAGTTETDFRRWAFRIAGNAVNAHLRQTRRRQELWEAAAQSRHLPARDSDASSATALELLDWPAVYQAILELSDREQAILTLRYFADLSHDEIAGAVGIRTGAVRTALSRILHGLRVRFGVEQVISALGNG